MREMAFREKADLVSGVLVPARGQQFKEVVARVGEV